MCLWGSASSFNALFLYFVDTNYNYSYNNYYYDKNNYYFIYYFYYLFFSEHILRRDIKNAISTAKNLKKEFAELLRVVYSVLSAADVGLFKLCINWFFSSERQTTPEIRRLLEELNSMPTSVGIICCLLNHNFIGYLNYKLLKEFQIMLGNEELGEKIQQYEKNHEKFICSVDFNIIMEMFKKYPNLAPVSHIGLPEFEIHLETPWNDKDIYEWTEFFEMHLSWPPNLFVTGVSRMCIVLTYAVLPIFVSSVVRDLANPEVLRKLEENGAKVQLSKELLEINDRISKPATNKQDSSNEIDKHTALSKQFSPSDGCIHVLGSKEHSCLMVNSQSHVCANTQF